MKDKLLFVAFSLFTFTFSFASIPKDRLVAHMGGLEVSYANTLKAFEGAFKAGIAAECDVRRAPDGTFYLSHDVRKDWQNATRLEDVVKIMKKGDVLELDIKGEVKSKSEKGIGEGLEKLLKKSKGTFLLPNGEIINSTVQPSTFNLQPPRWLSVKWNDKKMTKEYFAAMASSNIAVKVWTIDDEATAKKALERGARWVTTNIPLAMSGLAKKGTHPDYAGDPEFVDYYRTAALDIAERKMPKKKVKVEGQGEREVGVRLSTGGSFSGFFVWDSVFGVLWAIHAPERNLPITETLDKF